MGCGLVAAAAGASAAEPLALLHGNIYTVDERNPHAEAVIAVDGRITYVGSNAGAMAKMHAGARTIDLNGQTVFPGLTDSHAHLEGIGERELTFDLQGTASLAELKQKLAAWAAAHPGSPWIVGRGWIESRWSPAVFPSKSDIDPIVADRPVVLRRADGHATLANSAALKIAGIDRDTPNPAGGQILKDANGEPTGMLVDNAMELVYRHVPPPTDEDRLKALEVGAARSVRVGWTQLQNAGTPFSEVDLLCRLYTSGRIKLRVYNAIGGPSEDAEQLLREGAALNRCGDRLTVRTIKLYIDGALGSRGAALLAPYSDSPSSTGLLVNQPEALAPILREALKRGIQIETHAIGDRGNRIMLDLYEQAFAAVPRSERAVAEPRWRIEHAQILSPEDIPRFAKLGVIASMQPSHAIGDLFFAPKRLGPERLVGAYAWKSLLDSGAIVTAGTDAPVEVGDPRIEFYAAVARRSLDGFADASWHREQRVSRAQALKMLTLAPAYAAFQEGERGSIEVGKQADFTVFDRDLMTVPDREILRARVTMTIIGGELAYFAPRGSP
ncbi:MAG TPA: amidohydrolase [Steroidobacteraceae bacterium]|nr:amidohydrolase [Steroidobacteraceae bacterium]